jgi:hypothetical protein
MKRILDPPIEGLCEHYDQGTQLMSASIHQQKLDETNSLWHT